MSDPLEGLLAAQTNCLVVQARARPRTPGRTRTDEERRPYYANAASSSVLDPVLDPVLDRGSRSAEEQRGVAIIVGMPWEHLSDEALIAKHDSDRDGVISESYIDELFRRHHLKVARWCLLFTGDRESAADLAQEICAKAYQSLSSFKGQSKFSTWLFSIARNHCFNAIRARSHSPAMNTEEEVMETLPDLGLEDPYSRVERRQRVAIARQLINENLDDTEKDVFTLHFSEELPLDVITRLLNLSNPSGAKAYVVSAKRKIERAVKRWKARTQSHPGAIDEDPRS